MTGSPGARAQAALESEVPDCLGALALRCPLLLSSQTYSKIQSGLFLPSGGDPNP